MAFFIPANKSMRDNYHGVSRLHDDIDRLFEGFFPARQAQGSWPERQAAEADFAPRLDAYGDEEKYAIHIELPGVSPDEVKIRVDDSVLTVSGEKKAELPEQATLHLRERFYGAFSRSLTLPDDADADAIRAFAKDGVLSVEIPRKKPEAAKTRTIEVRRA